MSQEPTKSVSLDNLALKIPNNSVVPGFKNRESFELMQRIASVMSTSTLVPVAYRANIEKYDRSGNLTSSNPNPNALANTIVALNIAGRVGADELMVMQNLHIIEGRPSWSSQWVIASINSCGRFSSLHFDLEELGQKEVTREEVYWQDKQRMTRTIKVNIKDMRCIAWALEKETGERLESPPVTIEMAVQEGWYTKNGSKWQTMPEVMLRYRSASFFGKFYAPEILMGLATVEETEDVIDVTPVRVPEPTVDIRPSDTKTTQEAELEPTQEPETVEVKTPVQKEATVAKEKPVPEQKIKSETKPTKEAVKEEVPASVQDSLIDDEDYVME